MRYCDFINEFNAGNYQYDPVVINLNPLKEFPFRGTKEEFRQCALVLKWMLMGESRTKFLTDNGVDWFKRYEPGEDICFDLSNVDHTAVQLTLGKSVHEFENVAKIREAVLLQKLSWESFLLIQPDDLGAVSHKLYRISHLGDQLMQLINWLPNSDGEDHYVTGTHPRFAPAGRESGSKNYLKGKVNYVSPVTGFGVDNFYMGYNERVEHLSAYHGTDSFRSFTHEELNEMKVPHIGFNMSVDISTINVHLDLNRIATLYTMLAMVIGDFTNTIPARVSFLIKKPVPDLDNPTSVEYLEREAPVVRLGPSEKPTIESYEPEDFQVANLLT